MGGSSSAEKAAKAQTQANQEQERINYTQNVENRANEDKWYGQAIAQERQQRNMMFMMDLENNSMMAGNEASMAVTQERADAIKKGGQILTDFERQEKTRLMEAKKGVGQVSEKDFSISEKDRKWAENLLSKPAEYWEARRKEAYDRGAAEGQQSSYGGHQAWLDSGMMQMQYKSLLEGRQPLESEAAGADYGSSEGAVRIGSSRIRPNLLEEGQASQGLGE